LFDTAEAYGPFTNEEIVGEALSSIRNNVVIVTKFGLQKGRPDVGLDRRPERIRLVIDQALSRLRTDRHPQRQACPLANRASTRDCFNAAGGAIALHPH
jgi:predicted oxidoreductase